MEVGPSKLVQLLPRRQPPGHIQQVRGRSICARGWAGYMGCARQWQPHSALCCEGAEPGLDQQRRVGLVPHGVVRPRHAARKRRPRHHWCCCAAGGMRQPRHGVMVVVLVMVVVGAVGVGGALVQGASVP